MLLYAILMFLTALLFFFLSLAIYKGKIDLIHSYHREKVTDKAAYGKAFGKSMFVFTASLFLSGVIGLLPGDFFAKAAVAVLFIGIIVGIVCLCLVQKKYNKGIF